jgi:serine/threonine protein kinase
MAVRIESQAEPLPGYRLLERLGGGGFGEVWKAVAPGGLHKAIKFVYGDLEAPTDDGQRAEQELKALSRVKTVRHPYILSLERYDIIDGQLLIVMELADRNLWDRFKECRSQGLPGIPREELLQYMTETAEALDLMNVQYQLQHLDIKPQNIFLVYNHIKVADFGLVKDLEGMRASVTGGVTPVYAAPETFDGWVSRFCDQYSLAIVYQELLSGQRPFSGTNVRQLILQHLQGVPDLIPLPEGDREAIGRALSKKPDERFPTCQALVQALRSNLGRSGSGSSPVASLAEPDAAPASTHVPAALRPAPPETPLTASTAIRESDEGQAARGEKPAAKDDWKLEPDAIAIGESSSVILDPPSPSSSEGARWIRVHDNVPPAQVTVVASGVRSDFVDSEGVLFPALVLGVGRVGLHVLQGLRQDLQERFGTTEILPHIRLQYLDTDPETIRRGTDAGLSLEQILFARLSRPSHYLRPHNGRPRIDSWFNLKMLYRIPRSMVTTGLRALGRLALVDNFRLLSRRLRYELEACARPEALDAAVAQTGLGLRRNRPRVYVVTSLAGGTGGGMFLDLAYVLRYLLKQLGYSRPEVVGIFFLPPVDRQPGRTLPLSNTFAALTELNHFSAPGTVFSAQYDERDKPLQDVEPPYNRCVLFPLPEVDEERGLRGATRLTAELLGRELTTSLGHSAEVERDCLPTPQGSEWSLACQSVGLYRIAWPRQTVVRTAALQLCQQLVEHWISKNAVAVQEAVAATVADFWAQKQLGGEHLMARLEQASATALGQPPDQALAPLTAEIERSVPDDQTTALVQKVLQQVEELMGPMDDVVAARTSSFGAPLHKAAETLVADWGVKLAQFAVRLIEQPRYRLAGAEEAVRQVIATIEKDLRQQETLCAELTARAVDARKRMLTLIENLQTVTPGNKRTALLLSSLVELAAVYPRWRYQVLVTQRAIAAYLSLRGHLSDQLREINFCRDRLGELLRRFEDSNHKATLAEDRGPGRAIFPDDCRSLEDAVQRLVEPIRAQDLGTLDGRVQELIGKHFTALVHVCLASSNLLKDLEASMLQETEAFVSSRLAQADVAQIYLEQQDGEAAARQDVAHVFDEAAPQLSDKGGPGAPEICVLAAPTSQAGERFRNLAQNSMVRAGSSAEVDLAIIDSAEDILIYRERPRVMLGDLEQLGPLAYEAYRQVAAIENLTPHSRGDILEWRAAGSP